MARRKNTKRIDPRYFLNETAHRDEIEEGFTTTGPDPKWALTTGQIMALKRAIDAGAELRIDTDLKGILMNATQGHHPESIELLNSPEFQEDSRVKEMGY